MSQPVPQPRETPASRAGRREARFAADFPVRLVWTDLSQAYAARLKDISPGGARVVMEAAAQAPGSVYLLLHLPGESEPRRLVGEVRWQVGAALGLRFDPPLPIGTARALAAANDGAGD